MGHFSPNAPLAHHPGYHCLNLKNSLILFLTLVQTPGNSTEYCRSSSARSTTSAIGNRHSYAASAGFWCGERCFQDYGPRMEMHPRRRTSISARILRAGGESSRTSSTAVGIDWMCRPTYRRRWASAASSSMVPQCGTVCHPHCVTAACH